MKKYNNLKTFNQFINENKYQDDALDNLNIVKDFKKLRDVDKLALLSNSENYIELRKLSLSKIYRENGGTFGRLLIKIKIYPIDEQLINHRFSKEYENREGYLYPDIHYSGEGKPYVTVRFDDFTSDKNIKGGGMYDEAPIMLDNIFPIAIDDIKSDFIKHDKKVEKERQDFLNKSKEIGLDPENFDEW